MTPKNKTYRLTTGKYFPKGLIYGALALVIVSPTFVSSYPILAGVFLIIGLMIIFTDCRMEIDANKGQYKEYLNTLGWRHSVENFILSKVEYLVIDKTNHSQKLNSRGSSTTVRFERFNGYVISEDKDPIHIFSSKKKDLVIKKLLAISTLLDVELIDHSEPDEN